VFRPADAGRNEASTAAAGEAGQGSAGAAGGIARRGNGLDGDAESLAGFRQPLAPVAEIPQRRTLEASVGELAQNRDNAFRVMPICRRNIDPQGKAVFGDLRLHPPSGRSSASTPPGSGARWPRRSRSRDGLRPRLVPTIAEARVMIRRRDEDHSCRDDRRVDARGTAGSGGVGWSPKSAFMPCPTTAAYLISSGT
jgi:hypothetical protein